MDHDDGLTVGAVSVQIGGQMRVEASAGGGDVADVDGKLAIRTLLCALPETALAAGVTLGTAKCLPAPLYAACAAIFLLLVLLDVVLLSTMMAMSGRYPALSRFAKVAAVAVVVVVPLLVLLCKAGLSVYPKCMHPTSS